MDGIVHCHWAECEVCGGSTYFEMTSDDETLHEGLKLHNWSIWKDEYDDIHYCCRNEKCRNQMAKAGYLNISINYDDLTCISSNDHSESNLISHPNHYMMNGMETKDIIEACVKDPESAYQANVIKYITRYRFKGSPIEDLKKAKQYIDFILELRGESDNVD